MFPELARKLTRVCASWVIFRTGSYGTEDLCGMSSRTKLPKGI